VNTHFLNCSDDQCERTACVARRDYERQIDRLTRDLAATKAERDRLQLAVETLAATGCTDGCCLWKPRTGGMHTNGGCSCLGERSRLRQLTRFREILNEALTSGEKGTGGVSDFSDSHSAWLVQENARLLSKVGPLEVELAAARRVVEAARIQLGKPKFGNMMDLSRALGDYDAVVKDDKA
jgi:hypothetical protein